MKKALVIGHTGQDGSYLVEYLESLKYKIVGVSSQKVYNPNSFSIPTKFILSDQDNIKEFLTAVDFDEIYYLAAYHQSSTDVSVHDDLLFQKSFEINTYGFIRILQHIHDLQLKIRVFYAASSHVFGLPDQYPQTEETPFNPQNIYGISKVAAIHAARYYQTTYGIQISIGILYNHESPRRGKQFVTQKIVSSAVAIKNGTEKSLELGSLSAQIDWGYAPDYVKAFHAMLQLPQGDTFIVATGILHSVQDFVKIAFNKVELENKDFVFEKEGILTKKLNGKLCGDFSKLTKATGWNPETSFEDMIEKIVSIALESK